MSLWVLFHISQAVNAAREILAFCFTVLSMWSLGKLDDSLVWELAAHL